MSRKFSGFVSVVVIVAAVLAAGYWYRTMSSPCAAPLHYSIGTIDARFSLTKTEARAAVEDAEAVWEKSVGRDLFIYDPDASFTVNFIFDERQRLTDEEHRLREILDRKEGLSSDIKEKYEALLAKYDALASAYETKVRAYDNKLATHNGEVAYWNNKGGAPKEVYERLNQEERTLAAENAELRKLADMLNTLVDQLNSLGEAGNRTVRDYNDEVADYNDRFHYHEREFTQGDYYQKRINIYEFENAAELRLVLAHELGHALSLDHVDDPKAVMYYLMSEQDTDLALTQADISELARVCERL
jgi:hypothetical protein